MNNFIVDYNKETLVLNYNGETFNWSLKDGDKGDFWNSFTDSKDVLRDVNFSQEDENDSANLSVYSLIDKGGDYSTDMSSGEAIQEKELIGDAVKYFNS